jgi:hypothetical protein
MDVKMPHILKLYRNLQNQLFNNISKRTKEEGRGMAKLIGNGEREGI